MSADIRFVADHGRQMAVTNVGVVLISARSPMPTATYVGVVLISCCDSLPMVDIVTISALQ